MLGAKAVAYSKAGASGIYFAGLIERLGIADAVKAKGVMIPMGFTAEKIISGEADLAIQQISELMSVPGIDVAGPFPAEIQVASRFDAAIFGEAANVAGAQALLRVLTSAAAAKAYADGGLISKLESA
jgi:molybdate transport system substrate-binding protein